MYVSPEVDVSIPITDCLAKLGLDYNPAPKDPTYCASGPSTIPVRLKQLQLVAVGYDKRLLRRFKLPRASLEWSCITVQKGATSVPAAAAAAVTAAAATTGAASDLAFDLEGFAVEEGDVAGLDTTDLPNNATVTPTVEPAPVTIADLAAAALP
jgi:hypothetical protein